MSELYVDVGGTNLRAWIEGRGRLSNLVIGLRGVWTPAEKRAWKKRLRGIAPSITVLSDIEMAHRLAFGNKPGIVLNAGTGSICFGRNNKGRTSRAGGLGPLIGDEGSAFWIGREYLRLLVQRGEPLTAARRYVTGADAVKKIAGLSTRALRVARRRPTSAEARIVAKAQNHLRRLIAQVRRALNLPASTPVRVTGGLFQNGYFRDRWQMSRSRR